MKNIKIILISDTHGMHIGMVNNFILPDADMIIHSGDLSNVGAVNEVNKFLIWFEDLPFKHKIFIAGNHDWLFEKTPSLAMDMVRGRNFHYLENTDITIEGIKIWGSPYTPRFYDWAFNSDEEIKEYWDMIPNDTDIVITHGPALGVGDLVLRDNRSVGCPHLADTIQRIQPSLHVYGHIHCAHGVGNMLDTLSVNASICNERYFPNNPPIVVDYDVENKKINDYYYADSK